MQKRKFILITIFLFLIPTVFSCDKKKDQKLEDSQSNQTEIINSEYTDPNGYFIIEPPSRWKIQKYPKDPRGKVAFFAPEKQIELRVLAKAADSSIPNFEALIKKSKDNEAKMGIPMNIEPIVFNEMPAMKREALISMQGSTNKYLVIDILIDGVLHNLQYGGSPEKYDKYYDIAWKSMLTYKPLKQKNQPSPEDIRKHEVAKWSRLAKIALKMGNTKAAKEAISAGLKAYPKNSELLQLELELNK